MTTEAHPFHQRPRRPGRRGRGRAAPRRRRPDHRARHDGLRGRCCWCCRSSSSSGRPPGQRRQRRRAGHRRRTSWGRRCCWWACSPWSAAAATWACGRSPTTPPSQDWKRLGLLVAGARGLRARSCPFLGYVVSATLLYGVTAIVLGAPRRVKMFAVGFSVAAVVWLLFDVAHRHLACRPGPGGSEHGLLLACCMDGLRATRSPRPTCCSRCSASPSAPPSACCRASAPRSPWRCCCRSRSRSSPTGALILFAGIYYGGMYGGSTTAILLNTPGESASMVAALEGNKMARVGTGRVARWRPPRSARSSPAPSRRSCSRSSPSRSPTSR